MYRLIFSLLFFPCVALASHCTGLNVALFNNSQASLIVFEVKSEDGSMLELIRAGEMIPGQLAKFARLRPTDISDGDAVGLIKLAEEGALDDMMILRYSCHDHFLGVTFRGEVLALPESFQVAATQWVGGFNFSSVLVFDIQKKI